MPKLLQKLRLRFNLIGFRSSPTGARLRSCDLGHTIIAGGPSINFAWSRAQFSSFRLATYQDIRADARSSGRPTRISRVAVPPSAEPRERGESREGVGQCAERDDAAAAEPRTRAKISSISLASAAARNGFISRGSP